MRASPAARANWIQENEAEKCDRLIGTRGLNRIAIEPSNPPRRITTVWRDGEWIEVGRAEVPVPVRRTPRPIPSKPIVAEAVPAVFGQVINLESARHERAEKVEKLKLLLGLLKVREAQLQKMADDAYDSLLARAEEIRQEAEREERSRRNERARLQRERIVISCGSQHIDRELPRRCEASAEPIAASKRRRDRSGGVSLEELRLRAAQPIPSIKPLSKEEVNRQLGIRPYSARRSSVFGGQIPNSIRVEPGPDASVEMRLQWRIRKLDPAAVLRVYSWSIGWRWETVERLIGALDYGTRASLIDLVAEYVGRVEAVMKEEARREEKAKRKGR